VERSAETNETAFAELIQFLDERSLTLVMREAQDDGRKAWKTLKEHYASGSKPRIITLYNELTTLKKSHSESITDYLLRAENAATCLRSVKEEVSDSLLIAMVLKGLPDDYKAFVAVTTQAENVDDFVKFKTSLRHFEETENSRSLSNPDQTSSVMKFDVRNSTKPIVCYSCGTPGHKSSNCDKKKGKWCSICKNKSHNTNKCRKKKDNANKLSNNSENHSFAFKASDQKSSIEATNNTFLVDCGATTHIVNDQSCFVDIDESFNPTDHYIELADGTTVNGVAKQKGTVITQFRTSDDNFVDVKLSDVLFIPDFPQCIFSVKSATSHGCKVIFSEDKDELIAPNGTVFPILQEKRLYYLCRASVNSKRVESMKTWHRILGHCNTSDISKMENVVQGMQISDSSKFDCEICVMAKQPNVRNRNPDVRASQPFELVHTDLSGPIDPIAKDGFKYAIVFTDDFSGNMFTYFLKEKSDATKATEKFLADIAPYGKVKTLSFHEDIYPSGDLKRVRSDNGGEFTSTEFSNLLVKNQIKHEKSSPYSPHQNGTAERSWRTLFEMARSLLLEADLPKNLWTYAVMTATHIRNRCYSQRLKDTPYGIVTGKKPDVAKMQIFGSTCYPTVQNPKKLDARCKKGIFVGYDRDSPSYLVYDPDTRAVSKHRLVKFTNVVNPQPDADGLLPAAEEPNVKPEPVTTPDAIPEVRKSYPLRSRQATNDIKDESTDAVSYVHYCYHVNTPKSFQEAMSCPEADNWKQAMDNEFESLQANDTFAVTDLPTNKSIVGGKWVYDLKGDPKNPTFKARYVAKGYSQVKDIDYSETFSPTARLETVRTLVQIACQNDLSLNQMDVKTAFLHTPIEEEIYVNQPPGYESSIPIKCGDCTSPCTDSNKVGVTGIPLFIYI